MVTEQELFDQEYYFKLYPDVADAVRKGIFRNGYHHYMDFGRKEGRQANFKTEMKYQLDKSNPVLGDHLILNGYEASPKKKIFLNMVNVPEEFRPVQNVEYPDGNKVPFERYFTDKFLETKPQTFRTYLPVHWTAYYVNAKYGTDKTAIKKLQKFIDSLPKQKYFTIIQYDDGILNDISKHDILVYSMGCKKPGYYPLPLISQPLNNAPNLSVCNVPDSVIQNKDIFMSFSGANTHPIREELVKQTNDKYVVLRSLKMKEYYDILSRTIFALCPRGYGITSFRMFEAMHFNCIPVYISDDFWEPFNLPFDYGIKLLPDQISMLPNILKQYDIPALQARVKEVYEKYFVYSQCFESIVQTVI